MPSYRSSAFTLLGIPELHELRAAALRQFLCAQCAVRCPAGAYIIGALYCARAGIATRQAQRQRSDKLHPWWGLAILLLFLGINKLLALRAAQAVFVLFMLVLLAALAACLMKWRWFFKEQPLVGRSPSAASICSRSCIRLQSCRRPAPLKPPRRVLGLDS